MIDSASVGTTVTLQEAERFEPSTVVAVIVASPSAIAVTTPLALTVATASFDDVHVTDLFVAVSGSTVAVSVVVSFTLSDASVILRVILSAKHLPTTLHTVDSKYTPFLSAVENVIFLIWIW